MLPEVEGAEGLRAELQRLRQEIAQKDEWNRKARATGKMLQEQLAIQTAQLQRLERGERQPANEERADPRRPAAS
eukprot:COSAG01_NODE_1133_length_11566_cov_25.815819_9_plen_75_part_00